MRVSEALEQQTATAEILRVISRSPTAPHPVFEAIMESGVRLCAASFGGVFRFDGELVHFVTSHQWPTEQLEVVRRHFPMPVGDGSLVARAIRDRRVVQTPDYAAEPNVVPWVVPHTRPRSTIAIPMLRDGSPIGGIVWRAPPWSVLGHADRSAPDLRRPGGHRHRERAPLHRAGGAEHELTDSLARQTATAEILQDLRLADGRAAGLRCDRPARSSAVRRGARGSLPVRR
jgi:hypothetical protein